MTRTEAEHMLDAYTLTSDLYGGDAVAAKALREVILDAMTSKNYYTITMPSKPYTSPFTSPWTEPITVGTSTSLDRSAQEVD